MMQGSKCANTVIPLPDISMTGETFYISRPLANRKGLNLFFQLVHIAFWHDRCSSGIFTAGPIEDMGKELVFLKACGHGHLKNLNPLDLLHVTDKAVLVFYLIHGVGRNLGAGKLNLCPDKGKYISFYCR